MNDYWERRYRHGGTSGAGSVGLEANWKWKNIRYMLQLHSPERINEVVVLDRVIDIGCGDLQFWSASWAPHPLEYLGIDISEHIVKKNEQRTRGRMPLWRFEAAPAQERLNISAPIVLCIDLLFHIMDDGDYLKILENLCYYSTDMIFIHTWKNNPLQPKTTDGVYQKYRDFEDYQQVFENAGFELLDVMVNPNQFGALYIYKKANIAPA